MQAILISLINLWKMVYQRHFYSNPSLRINFKQIYKLLRGILDAARPVKIETYRGTSLSGRWYVCRILVGM